MKIYGLKIYFITILLKGNEKYFSPYPRRMLIFDSLWTILAN